MLPPVLELYVVWHPGDTDGAGIAEEFVQHFHGTAFTGLIGEAVEVFIRSEGWRSKGDAPRPIPSREAPLPNGIELSRFVAVIPLMGTEMAAAVEDVSNPWRAYVEKIAQLGEQLHENFGVFPYLIAPGAVDGTVLGRLIDRYHRLAASAHDPDGESEATMRCRDLGQAAAQMLSQNQERLTVFISHTKRTPRGGWDDPAELIAMVRQVIANTHLQEFIDVSDLQPGSDWDAELRSKSASSALLAMRTDLYPTREWCQREVLIAKREGMPVINMDANDVGEERGSFLMDHVPRIPIRKEAGRWSKRDVYRAINLLVNECLKRALWWHQQELAKERPEWDILWWAPHAPEPVTFVQWLEDAAKSGLLNVDPVDVRILHPDPPLGVDEKLVLDQVLSLARKHGRLDIMTPRLLAARGG